MEVAVIVALTFVCAYTLVEDVYAKDLPVDVTPAVDAKELNETIKATVDAKELNETIKAAVDTKDLKETIKAGKEAKKSKEGCAKDCGGVYDPICVYDSTNANFKPRTFGSPCALEVYNCETGMKLTVKNKGDCPGSSGVRLS